MMRAFEDPSGATAAGTAPPLGRAIVITSGKGGVGKTTTTANVGAALASACAISISCSVSRAA
jgi:Mrp family chromosome partitioning ATPase